MIDPLSSLAKENLSEMLASLATQRETDLFSDDVASRHSELREQLGGSRLLVIGGAGSIGSATIRELIRFCPAVLHIVDQSENNLVELVRDLRSSVASQALASINFQTFPIDFGSTIMTRFIAEQQPYDYVLNFAAVKHVRSEKDVYSLMQMLVTNILKPVWLMNWLSAKGSVKGYFCVSTDKAANPVNLMGASKRLMEHIIFSSHEFCPFSARVTSARFANVAFSDGSLLYSWIRRLEKCQPLAVPVNTRRFFISQREAGELCLLAAVSAPHQHLLIPRMNPDTDLHDLQDIARSFLHTHGYEPFLCESEDEAKRQIAPALSQGKYPLLLTPLDTSGEKSFEEFVGNNEHIKEIGMNQLLAVEYLPTSPDAVKAFLTTLKRALTESNLLSKEDIIKMISSVVPELEHVESGKNLDQRM